MKLYIVILSYNEASNIENVINGWYPYVEQAGGDSKLLVFDGTSPDGTGDIIKRMSETAPRLTLITCPKCGHGPTLEIAYNYALREGADFIFQTDADGQTLPSEFKQFFDNRDSYDVQIGYRRARGDGLSRLIITRTLRLILFFTFGIWVKDANTPFRLMSASALKRAMQKIPPAHNLTNILLTVSFEKQKEKMRYLPITFRPRQGGDNSINIKQIIKIGRQGIKDFMSLRGAL